MTTLAIHRPLETNALTLPEPRVAIAIRQAVASDIAFIDAAHAVGEQHQERPRADCGAMR
jgi:hypothetical protein